MSNRDDSLVEERQSERDAVAATAPPARQYSDSVSFWEEIESRRQKDRKEFRSLLRAWTDKLPAEITSVTLTYNGCGDSGALDEIEAVGGKLPETLSEYLDDLWWRLLNVYFPGWEINDGSHGTIEIDVKGRRVTFNHLQYVTDEVEHDPVEIFLEENGAPIPSCN